MSEDWSSPFRCVLWHRLQALWDCLPMSHLDGTYRCCSDYLAPADTAGGADRALLAALEDLAALEM